MKKIIICACFALLILSGCCTSPVAKIETVYVDKPIPVIPAPPAVPEFVSRVDALSSTAAIGDVSKAYVIDMVQLRALYRIQRDILLQYEKSASDFSMIQREIDRMFTPPNNKSTP